MNKLSISVATVAAAISIALVPTVAYADDAPVEDTTAIETPAPETPVEEVPETTPAPTPTTEAPAPEPVVLEPWIYDEYPDSGDTSTWVLDCAKAEWFAPVTHYYAEQTAPGVYDEPTITVTMESMGAATGDSVDSDCPNWRTNEDGSWYDSNVTEPVVVNVPVSDEDTTVIEASEVELKVGLYVIGRAFGGRG